MRIAKMNIYPRPSISSPLCFPFISCAFSTLLDNTPPTKRNKATGQINNETNHTSFVQLKNKTCIYDTYSLKATY